MLKKQDKMIKLIIKFIFCELFACVFMVAVSNSLEVSVTTASIVFCTLITTLIFYIVSCFKKVFKIFSISVFIAAGISVVTFIILVVSGVLPSFGDLFQALMDRALNTEELTEAQQLGVVYGIAVAISFLSVYFISDNINIVVLSLATFVFYGVQFASTKNRASMGAFAALIYIIVVLALYKVFEFFEKKSGTGFGYKRFAVFGIAGVMCICVALASAIAPFEENSFSKKFSLERFSNDTFVDNGLGSYYIAWSGVGYDDANLGGQRGALNFDKALTVTSEKPVYLSASYCDKYTGRAWELSNVFVTGKRRYHEKGEDPYDESNIPMNTRLKAAAFEKAGLEITKNPITVTYQGDMYFRTIFTTNGLTYIENPHKRTIWYDSCDNMYTNQYMRKGFDYSFDSYYFDIADELAYLKSDAYTGENPDSSAIDQAELLQYERSIHNTYLSLPDSVPERVKQLSEQIVAESEAETTLEKVMSIMEYLYQFEYVYSTSEVPSGSDFVDYFLFEEQKGYATYFASALAVMCREVGVPARYVKGFAALDEAGQDQLVCNDSAHAWVEVYFDGYGWVIFEPSPYFAEKYYGISMNDYRENDIIFNENGEEEEAPKEDETTEETPDEENQGDITFNQTEKPDSMDKNVEIGGKEIPVKLIIICASSLAGLLLLWLILHMIVKRRKRQIARMYSFENRQFVFSVWREIKRLTRYDGNRIEKDETPSTFLERIGGVYQNELIPAAAESFNKLLYSKKAVITDDDRAYAAAAYEIIDKTVKSKHKKLSFNFCRYILHII